MKSNSSVIIAATVIAVAVIASFTVIFAVDSADRTRMLTALPAVGAFIVSTLSVVGIKIVKTAVDSTAQKVDSTAQRTEAVKLSVDKTVEQTNGSLDARITKIVTEAIARKG